MHKRLNRKQFLRLLASGTAALVAAPFLSGCAAPTPAEPTSLPTPVQSDALSSPTAPPAPTPGTPTAPGTPLGGVGGASPTALPPTGALTPAATPSSSPLSPTPGGPTSSPTPPPLLRYDLAYRSRVVQAHLPGVWQGDALPPEGLTRLLDSAITRLTGLTDASAAWQALFKPGERIAIKVNTIIGSRFWTHPALAAALTARLVGAGIPAENLLVYDREDAELRSAGYTLNRDGPGVRCHGTNGAYSQSEKVAGFSTGVSDLLRGVDALINLPLVKQHGMAGFSFALKNHYGSINSPGYYHSGAQLVNGLAELNALAVIRAKTRLVIGDALEACLFNWQEAARGDSIFMSFDPVAHDTIGLRHYAALLETGGGSPSFANQRAGQYLARAAELGLGAHEMDKIEWIEETLS